MRAIELIVIPENKDILENPLFLSGMVCLIAFKYSDSFDSGVLQQEKFEEDSLIIDLFFEIEHDDSDRERIIKELTGILNSFFYVGKISCEIKFQDI